MHRPEAWSARALTLLALVWLVWVVGGGFMPSNDGPQHLFGAFVHVNYDDEVFKLKEAYARNVPTTGAGYLHVGRLAQRIWSPAIAHQVVCAGAAVLWALAWAGFAWGRDRRRWPAAIVVTGAAVQWSLWVGVLPFFLASTLTPVVMTLHERGLVGQRSPSKLVWAAGAAAILFLQAHFHSFAALMTGVILLVVGLLASGLRSLPSTVLVGAPSAVLTVVAASSSSSLTGAESSWSFGAELPGVLLDGFLPGGSGEQWALLTLAVVGATWTVLRGTSRDKGLTVAGVLTISVGVLSPENVAGWQLINMRLLPLGFMLVLTTIPFETIRPATRGLWAGCAVVWAFVHGGGAAWDFRRAEAVESPLVILSERRPAALVGARWAAVITAGPTGSYYNVLHASPHAHLAARLAPILGGLPDRAHDIDPALHPILLRSPPRDPWSSTADPPPFSLWDLDHTESQRRKYLVGAFASLAHLDAIVVYGLPMDGAALAVVGFDVDDVGSLDGSHHLFIGRFRGCRLEGTIEGAPVAALVDVGVGNDPHARTTLAVEHDGHFEAPRMPCGPVWLAPDVPCAGQPIARLWVEADVTRGRCVLSPD